MELSKFLTKLQCVHMTGALMLINSGLLNAQNITTEYQTGNTFETQNLTGFQTGGSDMTGMKVTARFSGGQSFTESWTSLGTRTVGTFTFAAHGVSQPWGDVFISSSGDTNSEYWILRLASQDFGGLTSLQFNGASGRTVFDCRFTSSGCSQSGGTRITGTSGSDFAIAAQVASANSVSGIGNHNQYNPQNVTGVYANSLNLLGSPAVGDVFEQFTLNFNGGMSQADGLFLFAVDTDNAPLTANITPTSPVPEPSSLVMMFAGLVLLATRSFRLTRYG